MKLRNIQFDPSKTSVILTAILLGVFIGIQSRSFEDLNAILARDMNSNVFQEIKILKDENEDLKAEVKELEEIIVHVKDQDLALKTIEDEIEKYRKFSGETPIFGPGINLKINGAITTPWMTDLINESFNSGAQAVSVNGIRLTNKTAGIDTLPHGQMVLNGSILSPPYDFKAIGESSIMETNLTISGGILSRLKDAFKALQIEIIRKDVIQIE